MSGSAFYDTNILAYAHDGSSPEKQAIAQDLVKTGLRSRAMSLSTQVFSEFYVVATRKMGIAPVDALKVMHIMAQVKVVEPTLAMVMESVALSESEKISYWDAQILVAAGAAGASVLYTEDLTDGREIRGVKVRNPFVRRP